MTLLDVTGRRQSTSEGQLPPSGSPRCDFCTDEERLHPEDGPADPAMVRFGGKWLCGFCALFYYGSQPARVFALLDLVANA